VNIESFFEILQFIADNK